MRRLLFITWDGPQVHYLEGLFLPILQGLREEYAVHVVQFTWGDPAVSARVSERLREAGISYRRVQVGPRFFLPLGIIATLLRGMLLLRSYIRSARIDVVLFRSTYPALMVLPWMGRNGTWVFDADGLPLEEKVDFAGMNSRGLAFRGLKWTERLTVRKADRVLVRSLKAVPALQDAAGMDKFFVVQNGRDTGLFRLPEPAARAALRKELGVEEGTLLLAYCGSLGPQYCVPEMLTLLEDLQRERAARLMILTGSPDYLERLSLDPLVRERLLVYTLPAAGVSRYLGAADAGLAIRHNAPSMRAVSPVKLGEYLLCGLPVVASSGIGDSDELLDGQRACRVIGDHTAPTLAAAARWVAQVAGDKDIQASARRLGLEKFNLEDSILSYRKALEGL